MRPWSRVVPLLMTALFVLPSLFVTASAGGAEGGSFSWTAPLDFTGDLLVQVGIAHGHERECDVQLSAAGRTHGYGIELAMRSEQFPGIVQKAPGEGPINAQAHAGDIDTRTLRNETRYAATIAVHDRTYSGRDVWTFAAFDLEAWNLDGRTFPPFSVHIDCAAAIDVRFLYGSTQVVGFDQHSLQGAGASAQTGTGTSAAVNAQDGFDKAFDTALILLLWRGAVEGAGLGHLTLHNQGSQGHFLMAPLFDDIEHYGPSGSYRVRLDAARVGAPDESWGLLGGLDRVGHLDEIVA